jgi:hypothetical protein
VLSAVATNKHLIPPQNSPQFDIVTVISYVFSGLYWVWPKGWLNRFLGVIVTGFRFKIVMVLVIFFAGVATGVYLAMPGEKQAGNQKGTAGGSHSLMDGALKSNDAARTIRDGMDKCVLVSRTARVEVTRAIQNQITKQDAIESAEMTGQ